uniref:Protein kinase domain-containing protein n=1 Tax=Guillardia theta TaxID=55529 RepID=A0A7S4PDC2_GUITH
MIALGNLLKVLMFPTDCELRAAGQGNMADTSVGEATEVDAEALNSENVYWIDYRKDRNFLGSELRSGRFKITKFIHASEVSSVGLVWEGRDKKKNNMRVAIKTPKNPATPSDWPSNWIKELKGLMTFSKLVHPNIMKVHGDD